MGILGILSFIEHRLQTLLKVPPKFRSGNHLNQVKTQIPLPFHTFKHISRYNVLGEALHNCSFPDSSQSCKHGVILCHPRKNLQQSLDYYFCADNWIQLPITGELRLSLHHIALRRVSAVLYPYSLRSLSLARRAMEDIELKYGLASELRKDMGCV